MTTVRQLVPGQIVSNPVGTRAVFVARTTHPIWSALNLVIWRMEDGSWSHDALSPDQEVGDADSPDDPERMRRLCPKPGGGLAGAAFDAPSSGDQTYGR